jgi:pimeloyl-ACP methyl ester carboxylesterase
MPFLERPDGCRLYYEIHGDRSALILLEGMGGDIPGWRRNIPHLSAHHGVIAYDFRGNGRSDAPDQPMTMTTFVDDTLALLDHLRAERPHVYGQSFGGMVAQEMALTHPERVRSLVLASTHAGSARAVRSADEGKVPKDGPYLALYSPAFARDHPDHVAEDILVGSQNPQPRYAGRRQWEAIQSWDAWDRLADITAPTLVLHGSDDLLIPVDNARRLAASIPHAELAILEGAGHVYHSEQPEQADGIVLEFLRRVEADEPDAQNPEGRSV